jgi:hypothetical protein
MNTKNIVKKVISEVAGISFEVRQWAQIIENYVKDYVATEREKMKNEKPVETPKTTTGKVTSWSAPVEDDEDDALFNTDYTHFESHGGEKYDSALVYGQELYINADVLDEFPDIENVIRTKLFEVELDGEGDFTVDTVSSSFPDYYLTGILEIIQDHMVMGKAFHNQNYDEVFAVIGDLDDEDFGRYSYYDYMSENDEGDYVRPSMRDYGSSYGGYYGGYYSREPKIDKIEIDGKQFPEAYQNFKVDKWVITPSNRIEYDHWKSGYNENGEYVVYLNMALSSVGGSALVHEVKHAYDDWNRMSKGAPPIRAGWEIKNIYTPDFEKLVLGGSFKLSPMIHPIIRYYYLGSKLEAPAYLENEYDNASIMGSYRDTAKKMMNFKASNFLDKRGNPAKGLQESWTEVITKYDIPLFRKFKNVVDFLNYTEKYFNKRGRDILKRIDKMRYVHNRPQPKYEPKVYTKPAEVKPQPTTQSTTSSSIYQSPEYKKLDLEIDELEKEWDSLYEIYLEDKDPEKRKKLDELDKIINQKLDQLNDMGGNNLPF